MAIYVADPNVEERLRAEREESGLNRLDEVWEGVYVMMPSADSEHQSLATLLACIFIQIIELPDNGTVCEQVKVSDREENWAENFRVPDLSIYLNGGKAQNGGWFWFGGPDFIIEILTGNDCTRDKLTFYSQIGVRELLLVERAPWSLELYRLTDNQLQPVGQCTPEQPAPLVSEVLPVSFSLQSGGSRPIIEVTTKDGSRSWSV